VQDTLDDTRRGETFHEWERDDLSSPPLDFPAADDVVHPVGALDENIGSDRQNRFQGCVFVERAYIVDHIQSGQDFGTLIFRKYGTVRPFQVLDRGIAVDGNNKGIAEGTSPPQEIEMTGMEHVKTTVGENDFLA
jgi:hypothetical protein